ncbi:MAG: DNA_ligase_IV_Ku-like, partial [uncultured Nocardioides sp.]
RAQRPGGGAADRDDPGHLHGLRPAAARRPGRHRRAAGGAARPAGRAGPGGVGLAGAGVVRRRGDAVRRHPPAGARGGGEQAPRLPLRARHPQPPLAQAGPPPPRVVRGRRLAPAGRHLRPTRGAAGGGADRRGAHVPRACRQRHRRRHRARPGRAARPAGPSRQPLRRPGATGGRQRHLVGRARRRGRHRHPRTGLRPAPPAVVPGRARRPLARRPAARRGRWGRV